MAKGIQFALPRGILVFISVVGVAALLGCSTTKKVDWDARIGSFTYDQAVTELGPPDKQATLSNASTVAEWVTRRSGGSSIGFGTGFYGGGVGVGVGRSVETGSERWLRLVFDEDGKLSSWSKN